MVFCLLLNLKFDPRAINTYDEVGESVLCMNSTRLNKSCADSRQVFIQELGESLRLHGIKCSLIEDTVGFLVDDCDAIDLMLNSASNGGTFCSMR